MNWLLARLSEATTWNSIAVFLGGGGAFLTDHGVPTVGTYVLAAGAGAAALAGFIIKERGSPH